MKNTIFTILLLLFCVTSITTNGQVRVGVSGGIIQSTIYDKYLTKENMLWRTGFKFGIGLEIGLPKNWALNIDVFNYSLRGFKIDEYQNYNVHVIMNIPLTTSYKFSIVKNKLAILPFVGIGTGINVNGANNPYYYEPENLRLFGFNLVGGIAAELFKNIHIGVQYEHGLVAIFKEQPYLPAWYNRGLEYYIKFFF
ncbi:PorT family protein [Bacteroidales bacterium OttesenSCG-928-I21]|nr:PorT family protein [Bacteroidales bacterium OttesenSCG-928-I21]